MRIDQLVEQEIKTKKLNWNSNPKIGWLGEANPIRLYYGTSINNIKKIFKEGIYANINGYVLCAAEPNTALLHSTMCILKESKKPTFSISDNKKVIFVIEMPHKYANTLSSNEHRFDKKDLYECWGKSDVEYYALVNVNVKNHIKVNWIKGYMLRNDS